MLNRSHPLAKDLTGCFLFNEGSGSVAINSYGNNHGAITGAKYVQGQNGLALSFNGASDKVNVPTLKFGTSQTFAVWVKGPASASFPMVMSYANGSAELRFEGAAVRPSFIINGGGITSGTDITAGTWHFWCGASNPTNSYLYVDGILVASGSGAPSIASSITFGQRTNGSNPMVGLIEAGMIFSRALAPAEVAWLHAEPYAMIHRPKRRMYLAGAGGLLLGRRKRAMAA